jgi:hypothetical protein
LAHGVLAHVLQSPASQGDFHRHLSDGISRPAYDFADRAKLRNEWPGHIIEGHAGMLDRLDSVMFAAPVVFHCTRVRWAP